MGTHPIFESDFDCLTEKIKNASMRQKDTSERGGGGGGRRPCVSLLMVTLSMQMVVCLVALVLFVLSSQWAQTILCALTVMMSCATLIGTIKKNYAIISVYLFIQPMLLGAFIFLLMLYLQVKFKLPYEKQLSTAGAGGAGSGDYDDEDFKSPENVANDDGNDEINIQAYLTLYFNPNQHSYLLAHDRLQSELLANSSLLPTLTIGRLLESIQLLCIVTLGTASYIAAAVAYCYLKKHDERSWEKHDHHDLFSYQSHRNYNESNHQTSHLLKHQNSADAILQAHHSVAETTTSFNANQGSSQRYRLNA